MDNEKETVAVEPETPQVEAVEEQKPEDESRRKYDELNEKYLRTLAEYDNYRKRSIREKESIYPEAKADVCGAFIPVLDNLERALAVETERNPFYDGVELVRKQLGEIFKGLGVEVIDASAGTKFDPNLHNAVMHVEDESCGEEEIVEELQRGYKIGDRILRHSMVKVAN